MKIATKTLVSLLIASATFSRQPTLGSEYLMTKRDARLEKLLAHHDRKCELRTTILNINPLDLKALQKKHSLPEIAMQRGFPDMKSFRTALHGKIKEELHRRGWSHKRIDNHIKAKTEVTEEAQ